MGSFDGLGPAQCLAFAVVTVRRILAETMKVRGIEFPGWNIVEPALEHSWRIARGEVVDPARAKELKMSVDGMAIAVMVRDPEIKLASKAIGGLCEMMVDPAGAPRVVTRVADAMTELVSYWYADPGKAASVERAYQERLVAHLRAGVPASVDAVLAAVPPPTRGPTTGTVAALLGQPWAFGFGGGGADDEDEEDEDDAEDEEEEDDDDGEEEEEDDD
jgi:hypothetical protein